LKGKYLGREGREGSFYEGAGSFIGNDPYGEWLWHGKARKAALPNRSNIPFGDDNGGGEARTERSTR